MLPEAGMCGHSRVGVEVGVGVGECGVEVFPFFSSKLPLLGVFSISRPSTSSHNPRHFSAFPLLIAETSSNCCPLLAPIIFRTQALLRRPPELTSPVDTVPAASRISYR